MIWCPKYRNPRYNEFMESPQWAIKLERLKARANGHCEKCGIGPEFNCFAGHHLSYWGPSDGPTPWPHGWDCTLDYLQYLCCDCHRTAHANFHDPLNPKNIIDIGD